MSGKKPLFASAPRLVLGIRNGKGEFKKIGYAIGLSINVSTNVTPVMVLGDYAPASYEPTQYQPVTGTFQIVRLQSDIQRSTRQTNSKLLYKDSKILDSSNITDSVTAGEGNSGNNVLYKNNIWDHLNPTKIITSQSFDIEIYMNVTGYGHSVSDTQASTLVSVLDSSPNAIKASSTTTKNELVKFMVLHDCRLTSRNVNIAQGQLVNEPLNFMALLAQQNFTVAKGEKLDSIIQEKAN